MKQKVKNVLAWGLSVLVSLNFLMSGYPKVMPNAGMVRRFENWGFNEGFAILIGVLEILGGLLMLVPKTAFYGAVILSVVMIGAIGTHLITGIGGPVFAILSLLAAAGAGWLRFENRIRWTK
ncbi:MAG: DoxX family protein [Roseivirga sp.]|nr:DoxX family protein [Roseivirga sp.]